MVSKELFKLTLFFDIIIKEMINVYKISKDKMVYINEIFMKRLGLSYDEFFVLDFSEQQRLLRENRNKKIKKYKKTLNRY